MSQKHPSRSLAGPDVNSLLNQGRALHAQGRINEAFTRYQAAVTAAPEHAEALHLLGLAYLGLGQAQVGIAFVRRAVERSPETAAYRANLATAEAQGGNLAQALVQMQAACGLQPEDANLQAGLAALQLRAGHEGDAERSYEAAISLAAGREESQPALATWHEALARLRYRRWAMPEALASAERATALSATVGQRLNMGWATPRAGAASQPPERIAGLLNPGALQSPQDLARASAARDLVVLDDFLEDPMALRAEALRLCDEQRRAPKTSFQGNFPGVQTPAIECAATMQRIADALGRPVKWDSLDNGALRVSIASDDARADVHVDNPTLTDIFGGVLYLSLPEHCQGGTRFYRHRATGWDCRPDAEALRARGHASFLDFQKRSLPANRNLAFAEWLQRRDATWECLFEVPMRFNRLILFRSDYFHAITELFGDAPENGRLVQLFHFEGHPG